MNKILPLVLVLNCFLNICYSQSTETAVTVLQPQEFFVNSSINIGGQSSIVLDVNLPKNTLKWYYTFSASRNKEGINQTKAKFKLLGQLTKIIDKSGTTAKALTLLSSPPGNNYSNVYLLASRNDAKIFDKEFTLKSFSYKSEGSRENYVSGVVEVSSQENLSGRQYLGFHNPSATFGITIIIEVVAIVKQEILVNGWTAEQRQLLYNSVHGKFLENGILNHLTSSQANGFSSCFIDRICSSYSPDDLEGMASFEIDGSFKNISEECAIKLNLDTIQNFNQAPEKTGLQEVNLLKTPTTSELIGKWRDGNSTFSLFSDGSINIRWDNGQTIRGKWEITDRFFIVQFGETIGTHKILNYSKDTFIYQEVSGESTIYSAKRIRKKLRLPEKHELLGTWKDNNSVFTLNNDGSFSISWNNGQKANGSWKINNDTFEIIINDEIHPHKIIEFTGRTFIYQEIQGQRMVYTANKK